MAARRDAHLKPGATRLVFAAAVLGAASVLAYAPVGFFPLIVLTLAGFFSLLDGQTRGPRRMRRGALIGGAFGWGLFMTGVSWVYVSLSTFGNMPPALAALATVLFCAFLALYPALFGALFVRFAAGGPLRRALLFAALWTLAEWLRGWIFTGFPWLAAGYAQTPASPLAGFAPIFGVYGVSFVTALLAGLLATSLRAFKERPRSAAAPAAAILSLFIVGALGNAWRWTEPQGEPIGVALLQGNVPQEIKWRPEAFDRSFHAYYRLALEHPAQLTLLPETALPAFLDQVPDAYLDALRQLAERQNGDIVFGAVVGDAHGYTNSAVSLGAAGAQRYDKSHLVPFGEFVPSGFAWFMAMAQIPMSGFARGQADQAPLPLSGQKIAFNICYEDAFGEEIIRALPEATVLANLSNVAWFGDSLAPAQHLQIAQMRARETGRMMLRATNTGMTAIIGADGRLVGALAPFTRGALTGEVRAYVGATPYVRWGNAPIILVALFVSGAFMRRRNALS